MARTMQTSFDGRPVSLAEARAPFVLAVDIGSGSTRCSLYDSLARPIRKHTKKVDHSFTELADGTVEIDPDQIVQEVAATITEVTSSLDARSVEAFAMDTFASSLIAVDSTGNALTPCFTYADGRSAPQLAALRKSLDEREVHQLTGTRLHTSYTPARLLWLRETNPDVVAKTATYLSIGEYVYRKLAGISGAAISTVAWSGVLNRKRGGLDETIIEAARADLDQFAPIVQPDEPIFDVLPTVGKTWPALEGAAWLPAIPDGYASNLGVGATGPETVAMSAATSGALRTIVPGTPDYLPEGLWSYSVSRSESIVGGALNDVGRVALWLEKTLAPVDTDEVNRLLREPPSESTPLVLPFLTGERSTGWAGDAGAAMIGISSSCNAPCLWRATMEGVALSYARVFLQMQEVNPGIRTVLASGGVLGWYPGFADLAAQAFGFPIRQVKAKRVTMRGTAVFALAAIRPADPVAELPLEQVLEPNSDQRAYYDRRLVDFEDAYRKLVV